MGRRGVDPGRAVRHHRLPRRTAGASRSPPTGPRSTSPDSRKPDVVYSDAIEADLSRRDFTVNAMALALPEPELIDPFGGAADLAAEVLRTPLRPAGVVLRRPAAHDAGGPVHRQLRRRARPGAGRRGRRAARPARDRVGRAHPRRARQAAGGRRSVAGPVVPGRHRAGRRVPARADRPCGSSRTRSTATRTCWPTPSRWWPRPGPSGIVAAGRPAARRGQAQDPLDRRRRRELPPPRGGRRPHGPRPHAGPEVLERRRRGGQPAGLPAPAVPHVPDGVDRQRGAPVRARRRRPARRI